jgi:hypothetical protein
MMQNLETLYNRELETVYRRDRFRLLFHDTVKLRIRLPNQDISVPLSILLLGISQLLARREFSREMCLTLLGKEWGYGLVARLLLECEDVCLKAGTRDLVLLRMRSRKRVNMPIKPPPNGNHAKNPNGVRT